MIKKINLILLVFALACFTMAERPSNEIPMYGKEHNPTVAENLEASRRAAELGWKYFYKGDLDTAIKRFNQAWMFDRNCSSAYWGFGVIMGRRAQTEGKPSYHFQESIQHLNKALELDKDNQRIMVDLAISYSGFGFYLKENGEEEYKNQFEKADHLFTQAKGKEPDYPVLWINWSYLKFYQEEYDMAGKYLSKAQELKFDPPADFVKDLKAAKTKKNS
jgi:tetratricopeptide (TPR) repeat protein